ncbi:hypothetical protein ACGIF2_10395 [Cellulomonas sp. P22]|uniref:hypothetical protein n=1 Tax=Cellulomonas sp. P22 TaxID=3373189 RepID=UPI0037A43D44
MTNGVSGARIVNGGSVAPTVALAGEQVAAAALAIAAALQVEWVSDAATRYRAALDQALRAVAQTARSVDAAHSELVVHDRATALAGATRRAEVGRSLLCGAR